MRFAPKEGRYFWTVPKFIILLIYAIVILMPTEKEEGRRRPLRGCPKITWRFRISSPGRPDPNFNHKILNVARLRLRFCSISSTQADLNMSAPSSNLFLDSP